MNLILALILSVATSPGQAAERLSPVVQGARTVVAIGTQAKADGDELNISERELVGHCISTAADAFKLPRLVLDLIYDVEGGKIGAVSKNTNGTVDIGPMQINSWWLPKVEAYGITYDELLNNACTNVFVSAWIYTQDQDRNANMAMAIARYHSPTPRHQARYLGKVSQALQRRIAKLERQAAAP